MLTRKKINKFIARIEKEAEHQRLLAEKETIGTMQEAWSDGYALAFEEMASILSFMRDGEQFVLANEVFEENEDA